MKKLREMCVCAIVKVAFREGMNTHSRPGIVLYGVECEARRVVHMFSLPLFLKMYTHPELTQTVWL